MAQRIKISDRDNRPLYKWVTPKQRTLTVIILLLVCGVGFLGSNNTTTTVSSTAYMKLREEYWNKVREGHAFKDSIEETRARISAGKIVESVVSRINLPTREEQIDSARRRLLQPTVEIKTRTITPRPANDAAPISANQLTDVQAMKYIERYAPVARAEMEKYGIPASIGLAQGLVESRAGQSKLAQRNNNHFGIKCFSKHCRKGHCTNMTDDHHKDFFRKYDSAWESWRAHSQLLSKPHYRKLHSYGRDYQKWAYGLKALGYATDRTYAEKLIGMIQRYNLNRFDQ